MEMGVKSAFVSLIGRPSSGKSTLLNKICGRKISIVSPVPQTTRNKIRGIATSEKGQLVFIDTPGFHLSEKKLNRYLMDLVHQAIKEVDLVLYLIDATRPLGSEERAIARLLASSGQKVIVAFNKVDNENMDREKLARDLSGSGLETEPFFISALTGEGVPELLGHLYNMAPEGDISYPEEYYTDQDPEFRIAEIIREKAIHHSRQELPHAIYVEIADAEQRDEFLWVRAFLCVERESQKGILIGKEGAKIKGIRVEAEKDLADLFPTPVKLDLRVKVRPRWRRQDALLKKLIR